MLGAVGGLADAALAPGEHPLVLGAARGVHRHRLAGVSGVGGGVGHAAAVMLVVASGMAGPPAATVHKEPAEPDPDHRGRDGVLTDRVHQCISCLVHSIACVAHDRLRFSYCCIAHRGFRLIDLMADPLAHLLCDMLGAELLLDRVDRRAHLRAGALDLPLKLERVCFAAHFVCSLAQAISSLIVAIVCRGAGSRRFRPFSPCWMTM